MAGDGLVAMAVGAHPDDIEFMMAGTLLMLGEAGARLHMWNLASGCYGTDSLTREEIVRMRAGEATASAEMAGATLHRHLVDDLEIVYEPALLARVASVIRLVKPDILLVPSLDDYMEDHVNTARLAVTAAFIRASATFETEPPVAPWDGNMAVYHAMPYGLRDQVGRLVHAGTFVDTGPVMETKRRMLEAHRSQARWLESSQGVGSYLGMMEEMSVAMGRASGRFEHAEGWLRHNPLGFGPADADPLRSALRGSYHQAVSQEYRI